MEGKIVTNMNNYKNSLKNNCLYQETDIRSCEYDSKVSKYVQLIRQNSNCEEKGRDDVTTNVLERDISIVEENPITAEKLSDIQQFYKGKNIFITGATGFLGKILIEKLLRSCTEVENLYLLVRQKKGKDIYTRVDEIFDDPVFDRLKKEVPKFRHKVVVIPGDCESAGLGLTLSDRQILTEKINIVFHGAATVKFDESLRAAFAINVLAPLHMLKLARDMKQLNAFIHVSTAYSNCNLDRIEEKFYPMPTQSDDLVIMLAKLTDEDIEKSLPSILGSWPNTYTFTKALAENELRRNCENLPLAIFRPAIVISTANEPIPSWIDNVYGPTGAVVGSLTGFVRTVHCDGDVVADVVPVDLVVNCLLAAARNVYLEYNKSQPPSEPPIFNYVSSPENKITWREFTKYNLAYSDKYPFSNAIWYLALTLNKSSFVNNMYIIFLHLLPAVIFDGLLVCTGQKPKMLKMYKKIHKLLSVLAYFCTHQIKFSNERTVELWRQTTKEDQRIFPFSMAEISWHDYFSQYVFGIRKYIFNESEDTLPRARSRWTRLYYLHQTVRLLFYISVLYIFWNVLTSIF